MGPAQRFSSVPTFARMTGPSDEIVKKSISTVRLLLGWISAKACLGSTSSARRSADPAAGFEQGLANFEQCSVGFCRQGFNPPTSFGFHRAAQCWSVITCTSGLAVRIVQAGAHQCSRGFRGTAVESGDPVRTDALASALALCSLRPRLQVDFAATRCTTDTSVGRASCRFFEVPGRYAGHSAMAHDAPRSGSFHNVSGGDLVGGQCGGRVGTRSMAWGMSRHGVPPNDWRLQVRHVCGAMWTNLFAQDIEWRATP